MVLGGYRYGRWGPCHGGAGAENTEPGRIYIGYVGFRVWGYIGA